MDRKKAEVTFTRIRRKQDGRLILEVKSYINGIQAGLSRTVADPPDHDMIMIWFEEEESRLGMDIDYFLAAKGIEKAEKKKEPHGG